MKVNSQPLFINHMEKIRVVGLSVLLFCFVLSNHSALAAQSSQLPRNVILIIGDGMDDNQITIARNYLVGAQGKLVLDTLPQRSSVQVMTVSEEEPNQIVYVADSANSATAMATGQVTARGRIATTAKTDQDIPTLVELAKLTGLKAGIVTTASITDATPAAFVAHVNYRGCEGPQQMMGVKAFGGILGSCQNDIKIKGGKGAIAEQIADSDIDVLLGGGYKFFKQQLLASNSKETVLSHAKKNGFHTITDLKELNDRGHKGKVLGLFADKTLAVRLVGEEGHKAELVGQNDTGEVTLSEPFICVENPAFKDVPQLADMTDFALSHLSKDNDQGFFLMIESASIDKESHARRPCGHIGETQQLDEALQVALNFTKTHPDTMILVTADHGQAAQLIPQQSMFLAFDKSIHSPGHFARIKTPEGGIMGVNYATNNFGMIAEHSGVQVPLYASRTDINLPVHLMQTDIFSIIVDYLNLDSK